MDSVGAGYYLIGTPLPDEDHKWYTKTSINHRHELTLDHNHAAFNSGSAGTHSHSVDLPSLGTQNKTTTTVSSLPPYYGLLKLMRIR